MASELVGCCISGWFWWLGCLGWLSRCAINCSRDLQSFRICLFKAHMSWSCLGCLSQGVYCEGLAGVAQEFGFDRLLACLLAFWFAWVVGLLGGWLVGWFVGWLAVGCGCWLACLLDTAVGWQLKPVGWLAGRLQWSDVGLSVSGRFVRQSSDHSSRSTQANQLPWVGWYLACLVGCLVGCLLAWLVGWVCLACPDFAPVQVSRRRREQRHEPLRLGGCLLCRWDVQEKETNQPTNQPMNCSTDQPTNQTTNQPTNKPFNHQPQ